MAWSKEAVMTNNLYADDRYPDGILWSDTRVTCVICVPVLTRDNECSVVIELYRNDGFAYEEVGDEMLLLYSTYIQYFCCFMTISVTWTL